MPKKKITKKKIKKKIIKKKATTKKNTKSSKIIKKSPQNATKVSPE